MSNYVDPPPISSSVSPAATKPNSPSDGAGDHLLFGLGKGKATIGQGLGALIKWGWVACDERQKKEGRKFWYNAYWKTGLAKQKYRKELMKFKAKR